MSVWEWIYRIAWGILLVLCAIGIVCAFVPESRRLHGLQETRRALEEENRRIDAHIKDLQTRQARFDSDPAFVERTARELGMAKPHETVFRVVRDKGSSRVAPDAQ